MATKEDLQQQRKDLERLAKLKQQLAEIDLSASSAQAEKLQKNINKITNSLVEMGMAQERIDAFYQAFIKANAAINEVSVSISGNLLKSIRNIADPIKEGLENFTTPIENLKAGAENITQLLQTAIQRSTDLETYALEKRRENTRDFVQGSIKLTSDLAKAYEASIKNEGSLGSAKFANLNVEKEISNTLLYINALDKMRNQLAGGYYSSLRLQATTVLEMLQDLKVMNQVHRANNDLAKEALLTAEQNRKETQLRQRELDKEYDEYLKNEQKKEEAAKRTAQKIADDQRRIDDQMSQRATRRILKAKLEEVEAEEEKQRKLDKLREQEQRKYSQIYESSMGSMLSKLPGASVLGSLAKLGVVAQVLALLIGLILKFLLGWDAVVSKFTEKLSISRKQAEATLKAAGALGGRFGFANIHLEQMATAIAELNEGLGGMDITPGLVAGNQYIERMIGGTAILTDVFGLSGKEVAGMLDASIAMGVSLSSNTIMATSMSKGIMSANKLMQSLANLSPRLLTGFKGSNAQLISMVSKMKLLGVEANNVVSANNKLLDIESSITNAFEAQVATGAQINIDRLMALQMSGKYSDVLDEQLRVLQREDYLNRPALAQQLIAEGLGLDAETASQMMLRKVLADKVGITDELIRKRKEEGKLIEDDIRRAEKLGKITKMEADMLADVADQYDSKTIQEKFIRSLNDFSNQMGSTMGDLVKVLRELVTAIGSLVQMLAPMTYGLGAVGTGITSAIAGVGLAAGVILLAKRGVGAVRSMSSILKGGTVATAAETADAASKTAKAMPAASNAIGLGSKFMKGLKGTAGLGAIATAADFGLQLASGKPAAEAAGRAGLSGGFGIAGAALGSLIPIPVVGTLAGGFIGSAIGDYLGDQVYGTEMTSENASFLQSKLNNYQTMGAVAQASTAAASSELLGAINMMSSKLDTANGLLSSLNNKPSQVSVELDGEKVGKAVMNYSGETMDRNRVVGNTYGAQVGQYPNRLSNRQKN